MTYAPFPIAAFNTGIDRSLPPWLIPDEAYTELTNAFVRRGVVTKRSGLRKLGEFLNYASGHAANITAVATGASTILTVPGHGIPNTSYVEINGVLGTTELNYTGSNAYWAKVIDADHIELRVFADGPLDSSSFGSYTSGGILTPCNGISTLTTGTNTTLTTLAPHGLTTGRIVQFFNVPGATQINGIYFQVEVLSSTSLRLKYPDGALVNSTTWGTLSGPGKLAVKANDTVLEMATTFNDQGKQVLVLFSKNRICVFDYDTQQVQPLTFYNNYPDATEILSTTFNQKLWFTGLNVPVSSVDVDQRIGQPLRIQYSADSGDLVTSARSIIDFGGRLLLLRPQFAGNNVGDHRQRIHYSSQLAPDNQTVPFGADDWRIDTTGFGGYIDLDTNDAIVGADKVKGGVAIFCENSYWLLRETPSASLPFVAQRINLQRVAAGSKSMLSFENTCVSLGKEAIIATDGVDVQRLDEKIPQYIADEIDQNFIEEIVAARDLAARQVWWLYPDQTGYAALVFQEESKCFSRYAINLKTLGNYLTSGDSPTWSSFDGRQMPELKWSEANFTWNSFELQPRYPVLIGADDKGSLFYVNQGFHDDGKAITMTATSKQLNPFLQQGVQARLGYIDFLVLTDSEGTNFKVQAKCDANQTPYMQTTIPCQAANASRNTLQRVPKRIYCNCTGNFHQITISHSELNGTLQLEGVILYFAKTTIPLSY